MRTEAGGAAEEARACGPREGVRTFFSENGDQPLKGFKQGSDIICKHFYLSLHITRFIRQGRLSYAFEPMKNMSRNCVFSHSNPYLP